MSDGEDDYDDMSITSYTKPRGSGSGRGSGRARGNKASTGRGGRGRKSAVVNEPKNTQKITSLFASQVKKQSRSSRSNITYVEDSD